MPVGKKEKKRKRPDSYNHVRPEKNRQKATDHVEMIKRIDSGFINGLQSKRRRLSKNATALVGKSIFSRSNSESVREKFVQRRRNGVSQRRQRMVEYDRQDVTEVVRAIVVTRKHYMESEGLSEEQVRIHFLKIICSLLLSSSY